MTIAADPAGPPIPPAGADGGDGHSEFDPAPGTPGSLLTGQSLIKALEQPELIFRTGSWTSANIRGPGYDLRLAGDLLIYPSAPGRPDYRVVERNAVEVVEFTLDPGDAALISTIECLSLDRRISATIGHKWLFAARGLLMMTGNAVHPCYGRHFDPDSKTWLPKDDERLHFVVANVGPDSITLRKGDRIAHLQFFCVEPNDQGAHATVEGFELLRNRLFNFPADGTPRIREVAYFRSVRGLSEGLKTAQAHWQNDYDEISRRTRDHDIAISRQTDVTSLIIVFGVFLVAATLLGFVLATLANLIEKLPHHLTQDRSLLIAGLAVLYGLCCVGGVSTVAVAVWTIVRKRLRKPDDKKAVHGG